MNSKYLKLIRRILTRTKHKFYDKPRYFVGTQKYKTVLNSGERYDPSIGSLINWFDSCHPARYDFAKNYISNQDVVLDIACGTGYGTAILSSVCLEAIGVDLSPAAIKYAKSNNNRKNTKFVISDFFQNKFIADVVISFETIEHLKVENIEVILEKLISFTNQMIIGSIPYEEPPGDNPYHHLFNLNESSLQYLREFGIVEFYYQSVDGHIYPGKPENYFIQNLIFVFRKG